MMDTIFTTQGIKNPNYCNVKELRKICTDNNIDVKNKKKWEMVSLLRHLHIPYQIKINCCGKYFYVVTDYIYYKSMIKTYDDLYREVYEISYNHCKSKTLRYCKTKKELLLNNKKVVNNHQVVELNRLRNMMMYLDLYHVYIFNECILIKDIFIHMMKLLIEFLEIPNTCYKII
jgi:hypothetical protein